MTSQACPQCHIVNSGARFCDQCGREQPRPGSLANLRLLRVVVYLLTALVAVGAIVTAYLLLAGLLAHGDFAFVDLAKAIGMTFAALVQRELLKLLIEVRERV